MARRRERLNLKHPEHLLVATPDLNEAFAMRTSATYLKEIADLYPLVDSEALDVLLWVLGPDTLELQTYLYEERKSSGRGSRACDEEDDEDDITMECAEDMDEYTRMLRKHLRKLTKQALKKYTAFTKKLLAGRIQKLSRGTASEIELKLESLRKMFKLTDIENRFCTLLCIATTFEKINSFFIDHLECQTYSGRKYLKSFLGITSEELSRIQQGTLAKIGMFEFDRHRLSVNDDFESFFNSASSQFTPEKLYARAGQDALPLEYHVIGCDETAHVLDLLRKQQETSTHVLLYGPAGTGKTSYARGIAKELGVQAFEISKGDEDNEAENRRTALIACSNMTNNGDGSLILVDEADNLLNTESSWFFRGETRDKGWLNKFLDEPGRRIIWITNRIKEIDESVLRRMSYSLHFRHFSQKQREILWRTVLERNQCSQLVEASEIEPLAEQYAVSAGAIDLAVKKAKEISPGDKTGFLKAVHLGLQAHRTVTNGGIRPVDKESIESNYGLEGLNIKGDLPALLQQLDIYDDFLKTGDCTRKISMNLLFYGAPGSGKSEMGRYIAHRLGRELMVRRASDILSKWVGQTEQNIAAVFAEAEAKEAVLVIDEADSFIFTRDIAQHSWETTQVNEFLTQMERYRGLLICTTNRFAGLDDASIRRFNQKIGFDFLTVQGTEIFYDRFCTPLAGSVLDASNRDRLRNIRDLAPGDFKIVRDRYCFFKPEELSHEMLVAALEGEALTKSMLKGKSILGFKGCM